jgi:uncharacterized protein
MLCLLDDPIGIESEKMTDWGEVDKPIGQPVSRERGILIFRNPDRSSEMGVWECTPGTWRCEVQNDEFCHFLSGRAIYTEDSGETTVVTAGSTAAFPAGWKGDCTVVDTVRKVYMVR